MKYRIDYSCNGMKIAQYLKGKHGFSSRMLTKLRKTEDGILKNGVPAKTIDVLRPGDLLEICFAKEENTYKRSSIQVPILYEDRELVVFDKPWGMPTHTTPAYQTGTLANVFAYHCDVTGEYAPFRVLGRLDYNTSGCVVCAKNQYVAKMLQHGIQKTYYGFVTGVPHPKKGKICAPIGKPDNNINKRCVMEDGKFAVTDYCVMRAFGKEYALCEFVIHTGRTHQIRVHMSYIGHPLLGDVLYGGNTSLIQRHALHCGCVEFTHPITGRNISVSAVLPPDMHRLLLDNF